MRDLILPKAELSQASKTAFRSHCARPTCVSEASCPNFEPRAHARFTGLTKGGKAPNALIPKGMAEEKL